MNQIIIVLFLLDQFDKEMKTINIDINLLILYVFVYIMSKIIGSSQKYPYSVVNPPNLQHHLRHTYVVVTMRGINYIIKLIIT